MNNFIRMPLKITTAAFITLFEVFAFSAVAQHDIDQTFALQTLKNISSYFYQRTEEKKSIPEKNSNEYISGVNAQVDNYGVAATAVLVRGPYMNLATQSSIIIRWRTDIATDSKVSYGTTVDNLANSVTNALLTTEHIVQLNGLTTNTQYFYSIGSTNQILQGDANNYFKTLPIVGSKQKIRILAMGDMGTNSTTEKQVQTAYLTYNGVKYTDVWLLLGDNAYTNGLDSEFQNNFFNIYQTNLTKNHVLWPATGNHDYANSSARQSDHLIPYYNMFSLPAKGEAGGIASNTEAYYSYNYGNIHFVSLDSYGWEAGKTRLYDTTGPQAIWLKQDLAANTQPWTVVYFHHPPYSKGVNSDVDSQEIKIRMRIVPIFERYKVDLVLCGHSHIYERSFLINGHYGLENSFDISTMALSNSSAVYNGTANSCPYEKNSNDARNGIVYAVVGSSGQIGGTSAGYPHNAMEYSNNSTGGAMVIEVEDNRLDAKWVCSDGVIRDQFTIMKNVNKVIDTTVSFGSTVTLTASWMGSYAWSNGATTRSITVTASSNISFTVSDSLNCLKDSFHISLTGPLSASVTAGAIACSGGTTTATVTASGGTPPYTGTGTFTVAAGTYNYIVTDSKGSSANTSITVTQPTAISVSVSTGTITCFGGTTTITVNATGGTGAYMYSFNGGTYQTSNVFNTVKAGNYSVTVKDANGCTTSKNFSVTQPASAITITVISKTNPSCKGGTDGSIQVSANGGAIPYVYRINNSAFSSNNTFNNLKAGTYTVTAQDANGCASSTTIKINDGRGKCLIAGTMIAVNSTKYQKISDNDDVLKIKVLPNPANREFGLQIETNKNAPVEIVITDIYGRKVFKETGSAARSYTFGNDFASGLYILQVVQEKMIQRIKLIKGK
jgi:hypothetical protein